MSKKYKIIAKVSKEKFVKYHVNDLMSFTSFLDTNFVGWRFFNVFNSSGDQVANFTSKNRPTSKTL